MQKYTFLSIITIIVEPLHKMFCILEHQWMIYNAKAHNKSLVESDAVCSVHWDLLRRNRDRFRDRRLPCRGRDCVKQRRRYGPAESETVQLTIPELLFANQAGLQFLPYGSIFCKSCYKQLMQTKVQLISTCNIAYNITYLCLFLNGMYRVSHENQ